MKTQRTGSSETLDKNYYTAWCKSPEDLHLISPKIAGIRTYINTEKSKGKGKRKVANITRCPGSSHKISQVICYKN
jgi:hypothetical protein